MVKTLLFAADNVLPPTMILGGGVEVDIGELDECEPTMVRIPVPTVISDPPAVTVCDPITNAVFEFAVMLVPPTTMTSGGAVVEVGELLAPFTVIPPPDVAKAIL